MANEYERMGDELFDQRIHDAYEQVELSEAAQSRMLANLLAAQRNAQTQQMSATVEGELQQTQMLQEPGLSQSERETGTVGSSVTQQAGPKHAASGKTQVMQPTQPAAEGARDDVAAQEPTEAEVLHMSSRKKSWQRWLPLAAVLVVALVVVQVSGIMSNRSQDANMALSARETAGTEDDMDAVEAEAVSEEAVEAAAEDKAVANSYDSSAEEKLLAMPEGSTDAGQVIDVDSMTSVDFYPSIKLEDDKRFTALRDGLYVEEVDASLVGESIGAGKASSFDDPNGESAIPCEVYELLDDSEAYAVQYEGEDSYWRCTLVE